MNIKKSALIKIACGLFLLGDQFLKWQSLHDWNQTKLLNIFFGWQPFLNAGVAFGIPVPNWLVVILTIPILVLLFFLMMKQGGLKKEISLTLIFVGALSNFIDRAVYRQTIDYFRIFTGVFNVADIAIILGFILIFFLREKKE